MATAALRGVLVVAAVILGVFVLSRAFPTGGDGVSVSPEQAPTTAPPTSPPPTGDQGGGGGGGGGGGQTEVHDPSEFRIQVLNGTDVSGLAAETQAMLEEEGYRVPSVSDAPDKPVERTTITYIREFRADAEALQQQFFPDAQLESAAPDADADITITLGVDYAESA
ncbi:MAG TPA: LytR C-terminal domain-containing protein [Actinomycetota bacterium]|nr:LytR C-terminal domain-containing protein [Actinomycetota bacterium]